MSIAIDFSQLLHYKLRESGLRRNEYLPDFFRLKNSLDAEKFYHLLQFNSFIKVYDELAGQLKELVKLRNPGKQLAPAELDELVCAHLEGSTLNEYGVWVYYPWSNSIVHLL